jgi:lantibiotic biosynthesis protein
VPASGHLLNANQAPPEYQLLMHIGSDGIAQLMPFDWGPSSNYMYLPRVQSGRSILSCAQWRLEPGKVGEAPADKRGPFSEWFARWRERWLVPRQVYLTWADNRLLYDLDDPDQVEDLRGEVTRAGDEGVCLLQEALPGPEHAWLPSTVGGHHIVELSVSLALREGPRQKPKNVVDRRTAATVTPEFRLRPPGSDWLYLKLYGPQSGEDDLLAGAVRRLCHEVEVSGLFSEWLFLRYADPDRHLRLRFRGIPRRLTEELYPRLCVWAAKLVTDGLCQRFAFDTYEREVERYGGPEAMSVAETLFAADSRTIVDLLAVPKKIDRMTLEVVAIDDLLQSLGLDAAARLAWLKNVGARARKEVSVEYREKRDDLLAALGDPQQLAPEVGSAFARRRSMLAPVASRLAELHREGRLTEVLPRLYESYVHMSSNRLSADTALEHRALGLLLRAREAISHRPSAEASIGEEERPQASLLSGLIGPVRKLV